MCSSLHGVNRRTDISLDSNNYFLRFILLSHDSFIRYELLDQKKVPKLVRLIIFRRKINCIISFAIAARNNIMARGANVKLFLWHSVVLWKTFFSKLNSALFTFVRRHRVCMMNIVDEQWPLTGREKKPSLFLRLGGRRWGNVKT